MKNFKELLDCAIRQPVKKVVVVNGVDVNTLEALDAAVKLGLVKPILTGEKKRIEQTLHKLHIQAGNYQIIDEEDTKRATETAVKIVQNGDADLIMKGLISTDQFMKVLVKKENQLLSPGATLSHVSVMQNPNYHKLLVFTDAAVIPYPNLKQKIQMTRYVIQTASVLGVIRPKVAVIAPTEQIITSIQSCVDGATIAKMADHGQIEGGVVDGPMALDVAISGEAAAIKGLKSPVAGNADCLVFPNIDAANVFYKTNSKLCCAQIAGTIAGAKVPVVVSSRGDSEKTKLNSIALASLLS